MIIYTLDLTEEELEFINDRCSRKIARLDESNLKDIPCYRIAWQIKSKIFKIRNNKTTKGED